MKKIILFILSAFLILAAFLIWNIWGPTISAPDGKYFYIPTGSTYKDVITSLTQQKIIKKNWFKLTAKGLKYNNIKPGRYEIKKGTSLFKLVRMLKNGIQSPLNLTITKLRTKEDLAKKIGSLFEYDSLAMISFLNNADTLSHFNLDSNLLMTVVIPDTYTYLWNSTPQKIFQKLVNESKKFWAEERIQKATALGLTPVKAYILASIIEEETRLKSDKGKIASVYLNRIAVGMPLQADPTVKFALKNFSLRRLYYKHLKVESPFNTYLVKGLPPGPICTPSIETIDELLNAPKTDYFYFVASSNFDGSSVFTSSYEDHTKLAKEYQKALDSLNTTRKK